MALVKLEKFKDPYYTYTTSLAKQSCSLTFEYSDYDESWYLTIKDSEGVSVKDGIRLKCGGFHTLKGLADSCFLYVLNTGSGKDFGIKSFNNFDIFVGWEE